MKNDELMLNIIFEEDNYEMMLLMKKDITLKALLEALYYGIKKSGDARHFEMLRNYFRHHDTLVIRHRSVSGDQLITLRDNNEMNDSNFYPYTVTLEELGIVTTSQFVIPSCHYNKGATGVLQISMPVLFRKGMEFDALRDQKRLEYNISTRRIATTEHSVIDIIPPSDIPKKNQRSYADIIIPTFLSVGSLLAVRAILAVFQDSLSGFSMVAMMMATALSTTITQTYNYIKQGAEDKISVEDWRITYQEYLNNILKRIRQWQESDVVYLRTTYPDIGHLFKNVMKLDRSIFSRSQNDSDFMKVVLGTSSKVEPLFEIKHEKRDQIIDNARYKLIDENDELRVEILYDESLRSAKSRRKRRKSVEKYGERDMGDGALVDFAYDLATDKFRYLSGSKSKMFPPLLLDLKNCGALGIVYERSQHKKYAAHFIEHIIFELSYYHTPEDIQFVIFFNPTEDEHERMEKIRNYKNLPHLNELFGDASQFVFNKRSCAVVFEKLYAIMNGRTKEMQSEEKDKTEEKITQIVCIVFDDYDIKETGFSQYLPKPPEEGEKYVNKNGLTFIFVSESIEQLPPYCGSIIEFNDAAEGDANLSSRYNMLTRSSLNKLSNFNNDQFKSVDDPAKLIEYKPFRNPYIFSFSEKDEQEIDKNYEEAFRRLSALYYRRIAENGNVPSMVTLFDMYRDYQIQQNKQHYWSDMGAIYRNWMEILPKTEALQGLLQFIFGRIPTNLTMMESHILFNMILDNWNRNDVTNNLSVPIGANEHGKVFLDLHEKADGPHMLVAGTTGSGKSETIITYLIGLCMKYSPSDLNLMLVDMKGGGFSNRLRTLPHCVGVVDDTSGESEGISAVYMLKRFLEVLNAEIKYRKLLLNDLGVDNVDAYIRSQRIIARLLLEGEDEDLIKKLNQKQLEKYRLLKKQNTGTGRKDIPKPLSHLVLVVDEFTELKRFSSESSDIDFISEITTIARVGRTLGFHIILVSQNIEGAITDDIRVNSKSRICLKVATRGASKEMLDGRPDAASPTMPGNGRAYLLVGTGSKFLYFQSAYTGGSKNDKMERKVEVVKVNSYGNYEKFYVSSEDNERVKKDSKKDNEHDTQLDYAVKIIEAISMGNIGECCFTLPRVIFKEPLKAVYPDETEWSE